MTPTPYPTGPAPGPLADPATAPSATYRLQLQPAFPFAAAERAVPHLAGLGVSHLHLSPILTCVPGSTHGYDVTDHTSVRAELGGEDGLRSLAAAAHAHGLGLIADIVPNHMAVPADLRLNRALWETLREGRESPYARWFDIDWDAGGGRVLMPVLDGPVGEELPRLRVARGTLRYGERVLPLRAGTEELETPELLDAQHYRLAWWRLARTELNYRRFFTISDLIGLRVEDPEVFDATHRTPLRLLHAGVIDGLRVDHPDGLADPGGYLRRLSGASGGHWTVVEKILGTGEELPEEWPVAGTTGYDSLHHIDGLFTDPAGFAELAASHRELTRVTRDGGGDWPATARRAGDEVAATRLAAETARLTRVAERICHEAPGLRLRDHSAAALTWALRALLVRMPVYRPYVTPGTPAATPGTLAATPGAPAREADTALLEAVAESARAQARAPDEARAVDVVRDLALGRLGDGGAHRDFAARFGQFAAALRAKAVEDAAFYRYTPLLSACEVGGSPGRPALSPAAFHAHSARLQHDWPGTSTVLSTHDTKRSADVRAALMVLSECPERWTRLLSQLAGVTAAAPDPHMAWTAWQLAYGLGTPDSERLAPAVLKSVREAGLRTTWTEPDTGYENAVERWVTEGPCGPRSWRVLSALAAELAPFLRANVLGMALLHLTMPGVPDLYQGTEEVYAALVDPDNRRPAPTGLGAQEDGGRAGEGLSAEKARLTRAALRLRAEHPEWFGESATYEPRWARGVAAEHCVAYARSGAVITAVTRLSLRLAERGGWRGTALPLPEGAWRDVLTGHAVEGGGAHPVAELFADAPVALLVRH
jgi:(1->4)-alpha-D-glucan 1-alpha-D-glucosylmutase